MLANSVSHILLISLILAKFRYWQDMLSPYLESLTPAFCAEAPEAPALKVHERISRGNGLGDYLLKETRFLTKCLKMFRLNEKPLSVTER